MTDAGPRFPRPLRNRVLVKELPPEDKTASGLIHIPDQAKGDAVSPVHYVSKDDPPFLILHGTKDALVPYAQSTKLVALLKEQNVPVLLQTFPGGGRGGGAFG